MTIQRVCRNFVVPVFDPNKKKLKLHLNQVQSLIYETDIYYMNKIINTKDRWPFAQMMNVLIDDQVHKMIKKELYELAIRSMFCQNWLPIFEQLLRNSHFCASSFFQTQNCATLVWLYFRLLAIFAPVPPSKPSGPNPISEGNNLKHILKAPQSCKGCMEMIHICHLNVPDNNHLGVICQGTGLSSYSDDKPLL